MFEFTNSSSNSHFFEKGCLKDIQIYLTIMQLKHLSNITFFNYKSTFFLWIFLLLDLTLMFFIQLLNNNDGDRWCNWNRVTRIQLLKKKVMVHNDENKTLLRCIIN